MLDEKLTLIKRLAFKNAFGLQANNLEKIAGEPRYDNINECSPLIHAVQKRELEIVSLLLELGAEVNAKHKMGLRKFKRGEYDGYNSNEDKVTALHEAVKCDSPQMIQLLLSVDADVDVCNIEGNTALNFACCKQFETPAFKWDDKVKYQNEVDKHFDLIQYLVEQNADINNQNAYGYSPLHNAMQVSDKSRVDYSYTIRLVTYLCENKAMVNLVADSNSKPTGYGYDSYTYDPTPKMTPLLMIYDRKNISIFNKKQDQNLEVLKVLCQYGASLFSFDGEGHTILDKMIENEDMLGIEYLESCNALKRLSRFQRDDNSSTALHTALYQRVMNGGCSFQSRDKKLDIIIEKLLSNGANSKASYKLSNDRGEMTPLEYGAYASKVHRNVLPDYVKELVENYKPHEEVKVYSSEQNSLVLFQPAKEKETFCGFKPGFLIGKSF